MDAIDANATPYRGYFLLLDRRTEGDSPSLRIRIGKYNDGIFLDCAPPVKRTLPSPITNEIGHHPMYDEAIAIVDKLLDSA